MTLIEHQARPGQVPPAAGQAQPVGRYGMRMARGFILFASSIVCMLPAAGLPAGNEAAPPPSAARERIPEGAVLRLLGREVKGPTGEVIGQLVNVLVDEEGQPHAAILDYGGFLGVGRRRIAVAWQVLRFAPSGNTGGSITLSLSREQLKAFPDYKEGEPIAAAAPPSSSDDPPYPATPR